MSEQLVGRIQPAHGENGDDEILVLDLLAVIAEQKWLVMTTPVVAGSLALIVSLLIPQTFSSSVKIMPPQQQQNSGVAAMLGQLGGLAGAVGGIAGTKTASDVYQGVLESRTVADSLIKRYKLEQRYDRDTMDETRKKLASNSAVAIGKKDGFITVSVDDRDPKFAAELANAYVDELTKVTSGLALTEASQRRLFFEAQLKDVKEQLADAEVSLRSTQEKTGMIQPAAQVAAIIANAAQLKGTIAAKEVQIKAMRSFAAGQNPELLRTLEELRGLQIQLAKLENTQSGSQGDFMVPTGKIPEVGVEYVRRVRNVKYYETIFELLSKQYELAKIDEAKESSLIQVLDKAIPAEKPSKPKRAVIVLIGTLFGMVLGIMLAFMWSAYQRSRANPISNSRWQKLAHAWNRTPSHKRAAS